MFDTANIQRIFETHIKQMKDLNYFNTHESRRSPRLLRDRVTCQHWHLLLLSWALIVEEVGFEPTYCESTTTIC